MYHTIVVGTDGSDPSHHAVQQAGRLAAAVGVGQVHVVAAFHPLASAELRRLRSQLPAEFHDNIDAGLTGDIRLGEAKAILRAEGVEMVAHELDRDPAEAILDVADEIGADLIVVGSRGLGAGGRFLRGSVSTKVVHHAVCSVLVAHAT